MWSIDSEEEGEAIRELWSGPDRHVAIIGAALLEAKLETTIKNCTHNNGKINNRMFHNSGPLGSFSAKICVGFMLGLYDDAAMKELDTIKEIRNLFAHEFRKLEFRSQQIRDLCMNLKNMERYVYELGDMEGNVTTQFGLALKDRDERLKDDPRYRFRVSLAVYHSALCRVHAQHTPRTPSAF